MSDDSTLVQKVREAIRCGKLPNRPPERTWGGRGGGAHCAICGEPVGHGEVEYELEFARGDDGSGVQVYHVHVGCFAAWDFERERLQARGSMLSAAGAALPAAAAQSSSGSTASNRALPPSSNGGTMPGGEGDNTDKRGQP